jgi:hypothetical protein
VGLTNNGRDAIARLAGGDPTAVRDTATATSATTLTGTGTPFTASAGGPPALGGLVGHIVVAGSTGANFVYGHILSNTTSVLTIDAWRNPADPEPATPGTTPATTAPYFVVPGGAPCFYMGITTSATAFSAADATLATEIWFTGGGLRRRLASWAHTNGTATYTVANTFTANASDTLPQAIAKIGIFQHYVNATVTTSNSGIMLFETVLSASATLSAIGDNVQITDTVTLS